MIAYVCSCFDIWVYSVGYDEMICISEPASACKTGVDGLVEAAELIGLVSVFPVCACVRFVPAGKVLHECILKVIWLVCCFFSPCELIDFERCITCSQ